MDACNSTSPRQQTNTTSISTTLNDQMPSIHPCIYHHQIQKIQMIQWLDWLVGLHRKYLHLYRVQYAEVLHACRGKVAIELEGVWQLQYGTYGIYRVLHVYIAVHGHILQARKPTTQRPNIQSIIYTPDSVCTVHNSRIMCICLGRHQFDTSLR